MPHPMKRIREREQIITNLRAENPFISQAAIGRYLGVSRERARQILNSLGLTPVILPKTLQCAECGKDFAFQARYPSRHKYCSRPCLFASYRGLYPCDICGTQVYIRHKQYEAQRQRNRTFSCGMECRGESIRHQNSLLWELHREYVGPRTLHSKARGVPYAAREARGLGKPSWLGVHRRNIFSEPAE